MARKTKQAGSKRTRKPQVSKREREYARLGAVLDRLAQQAAR